jgi:uncharacterized heparinase superfamily protein
MAEGSFPDLAAREVDVDDVSAVPMAAGSSGEAALIVTAEASEGEGNDAMARLEVIEPGRALAIADFPALTVNPAERFIRFAYRLGVPGSMLSMPVGKKEGPRLLATATNPLAGDRTSGVALRAGHFLVHGVKTPIAQVDYGGAARMTPPFERVVHAFDWLGDLDACAPREEAAPVAERIMAAWLKANPKPPSRPGKGAAWSVGNTGARLLNWLVHAPLILSGVDRTLRSRILHAIADTARWLDRNVTRAEDRLGEAVGWSAIVAAGLLMPGGRPRRLYGEAGLVRALGEMVGDDGGVLSRSPTAQMEAIATLVKLRACYEATRRDAPAAIEEMLALLVPPLLTLTHGDGSLGSWQGAWAIPASTVSALIEASRVRTRPLREVRQWGFQRVTADKAVLQMDSAPPPMPRHARFGCASTLALEFSTAGQRVFVNCGGAACAGGIVPVRLEQGLRATAAHSTLTLDDANSTAILINGGIGHGVTEVEVERRDLEIEGQGPATRLEASHNGYAARYGLVHRRILILRSDGTELRGEDLLLPTGRKGKRGKVGYAIRFHLGPEIDARVSDDRQGVGLALADGSYWQFRAGEGEIAIEESLWVDGQARPAPVQQIVIQGLVSRGGGTFSWLLKKMS